mmetsp:Transcript_5126/g.11211  ORF Transcript_5126/g.11211 Transcript_5126/m.11211 type:complete len:178 (+) Transcript_5126:1120-1653(+)
MRALILGNGAAGAEKQCLALADILGASSKLHRVKPSKLLTALPNRIACPLLLESKRFAEKCLLSPQDRDFFHSVAPSDIVIGSGRITAPFTALAKSVWPQSFTVQIQYPYCSTSLFDAVVTPQHDKPKIPKKDDSGNIVFSKFSIHKYSKKYLDATRLCHPEFNLLPEPRVRGSIQS